MIHPMLTYKLAKAMNDDREAAIRRYQQRERLREAAAQQHAANAPTWLTARWRVIQNRLHLQWITVGKRPTASFTTKPE
ncbi:MAG: hypothetical protein KDE53_38150 [Caldilineaceae bacterium]|nr:hypothetical protein [Caldilineaceae bacterium]MCB0120945.1 hypothetical protein [Caldilineaceae bacterium]